MLGIGAIPGLVFKGHSQLRVPCGTLSLLYTKHALSFELFLWLKVQYYLRI